MPLALATAASGAAPASTAADPGRASCVVPDVVGVTYARARHVLLASGCALTTRQLSSRGGSELYTPPSPDPRQLVGSQSPPARAKAGSVTISLKPLCEQPSAPGPDSAVSVSDGPPELVAGLFVAGGPLELSSRCRHGMSSAGTLRVSMADGTPVSSRSVRAGRYAVFPLKPGRYVLSGTFARQGNAPTEPQAVTISAHRTTHLNIVADVR